MKSDLLGRGDPNKAGDSMQKHYYRRPSALRRDLAQLSRDLRRMRTLSSKKLVDAAFRERLMLTVTEVNGCRYCAWAHARMALAAGLTKEDVQALTDGELRDVPAEQVPAVLYAQHWAETDGDPDPEVRARVTDTYGLDKTESLETYMRMMRVGNLVGNSWDHLLSKVSGGRWGEDRSLHALRVS